MKFRRGIVRFSEPIIVSIIWLVILAVPVLIFQNEEQIIWADVERMWMNLLPFFILFAINHLILIPLFLFKNKRLLYFISVAAVLAVFAVSMFFIQPERQGRQNMPPPGMQAPARQQAGPPPPRGQLDHPPRPQRPFNIPPLFNTIIISFLVVGFDTGLRMMVRWSKLEQEKTVLEKENVQSQLAFLRTQISPHFFMNTLNNIHSQIDIDTEDAKDSIIKLSKLMRHLLYDSQEEKTSLSKEVEFIRSYINLMKLRYSDKVDIKIEIPESLPDKQIPPLLFTSLIENAFKHGISYSNGSFIHLKIELIKEKLIFMLTNSKAPKKNIDGQKGIGLENTRKRLDLLYPGKYSLDIYDNESSFTVKLEIPI
jgi:two-component sensor histidine kinase